MDLFESLPEVKKQKILQVCIEEFAQYGFWDSSTNRIIRNAGIAKGSLFKYFGSKEDLYYYILDHVAGEIFKELSTLMVNPPDELLSRLVYFAQIEMQLHLRQPLYFKLFRRAQENDGTDISRSVREKYGAGAEDFAREMLKDISAENLRYGIENTIDTVLWLLKGFNESFLAELSEANDIELIQQEYLTRLQVHLDIIRNGIYK